jgi:hypothetical protein
LYVIKGIVKNGYGFAPFSFKVNLTNTAPYFYENLLENQEVPVGSIKTYKLPKVIDQEKMPVKCIVKEQNKNGLPSFVKFDKNIN